MMFAGGNTVKTNLSWQKDGPDAFCPLFQVCKTEEISLRVIYECLSGYLHICQFLLNKQHWVVWPRQFKPSVFLWWRSWEAEQGRGKRISATVQRFAFHTPMQTVWICTFRKWGCPQGRKRGLSDLALWTALGCYSCHFHLKPTWAHMPCTTADAVGIAKKINSCWQYIYG